MSNVLRSNVRKAAAAAYGFLAAFIVHLVGPHIAPVALAAIGFGATVLLGSFLTWAESHWPWVGRLLLIAGLPQYPPKPKFVLPSSEATVVAKVDEAVDAAKAVVAPAPTSPAKKVPDAS